MILDSSSLDPLNRILVMGTDDWIILGPNLDHEDTRIRIFFDDSACIGGAEENSVRRYACL